MTNDLERLSNKRAKLAKKLEKVIAKLTKASQLQLRTNELVTGLTNLATELTIEKTRLDAMIAAGQNTGLTSLSPVEAGAAPDRSPASEDSHHPAFLRRKA